jgi:succinoglycan biosynthesis transport protein ExoP
MTIGSSTLSLSLIEWSGMLRRHLAIILAVFALVSTAAIVYVMRIPNIYRAETRILVNPQRVSNKFVSNAVSMGANERLNTLGQQVLSTSRLEAIFNELNLFPNLRNRVGHQELIDRMRRNIGIELKQSTDGPSSFTLSYQGESATEVAAVTNRLADSFIAWNLHDREQEAQGTTDFLSNELTTTKAELDGLEERLRTYKMQHLGQLPHQLQANMQTLSRLQVELQANVEAQSRLDRDLFLVKADPQSVTTLAPYQRSPSARDQVQAQLTTARQELTELRKHYTSEFPDVVKKQEEIRSLELQVNDLHEPNSTAAHSTQPSTADATPQAQLLTIERKRLANEQQQIEASIRNYQGRVDSEPIREQEISQLLRDYETARQHYASLLEKNYSAKMAAQLERQQQGGSFTLLDIARAPDQPIAPNRAAFLFAAVFFGLAAGIGAGILREMFDATVKSEAMLREILPGIPILGLTPNLGNASKQ